MKNYFNENKKSILQDYFTLLKFESVSADPKCKNHLLACHDWLRSALEELGFEVQSWQTPTYPTLFASHCLAGSKAPTLLIYNHYDVQPVDPVHEWASPPFEPTLKDGLIYARGAQDNKGQLFYVLLALRALLSKDGKLPINVKLCIEGDEEMGSEGLMAIAPLKTRELKADHLLIVDAGIKGSDEPAITLGTRGLLTMQLSLRCASSDLHSGEHGGIVRNSIRDLAHLLSLLHDKESGRVMVPGFYDHVEPLSLAELQSLDFSFNDAEYHRTFGALPLGGEENYSPFESAWIRPTLEFNGIWGGYTGPGFKTVIPAMAHAKLSCRLVLNQDPEKIYTQISTFLQDEAPTGSTLEIKKLHEATPLRTSPKAHIAKLVSRVYSEVFKKPCSHILAGGTIGVAKVLAEASGAEVLFMGLALPDDNIHAPNEHFSLDRLEKGMEIMIRTITSLKLD